jgi:hypothetical protein
MDIDLTDEAAVQRYKLQLMDEVLVAADRFAAAVKELNPEHKKATLKETAA